MRFFSFILLILLGLSSQDLIAQDSLLISKKKLLLDTAKIKKIDSLKVNKLKVASKEYKDLFKKTFGVVPYKPKEEPKIAFVRSLLLPGWGQITNKKHNAVKLPLIYGSAVAGGYFIYLNNKKFQTFKGYLLDMQKNNKTEISINGKGPYSYDLINNGAKQYRRWKQGTVIGYSVGWLLFAVEANATAHLKNFDEDDNISFKIVPKFSSFTGSAMVGVGLNLNLK